MFYKIEFDIEDFPAWSGAKDTKESILKANKQKEFNQFIEELFFDEGDQIPTDTEINDFLRFETDMIYDALGLDECGEIVEG